MKIINILTMFFVTAAVTACAMTREEFNSGQALLEGSPKIRADWIADCIKTSRHEISQEMADLMNVPRNKGNGVFCNRLYGGIANGRLKYEDIKSAYGTAPLSPNIIRVLQGR